jgi:hypothetical protein
MHPHRSSWSTSLVALVAASVVALPRPSHAGGIEPPAVPADLVVSSEHRPYLVGHAIGTQNYVCAPKGDGFAWKPFGPQATLFDEHGHQLTTHYLSPNPDEAGKARPTWQHSRDTSAVWANPVEDSTDPEYVEPGAIPWLKLEIVGRTRGVGGRRLTDTTFIQRVNTVGGVAPATGCSEAGHLGERALVPYETDYVFYKARGRQK